MRKRMVLLCAWALVGCGPPEEAIDEDEAALSATSSGNEVLGGWDTCSNGPESNCGGAGGVGKVVQTFFDVNVSRGGRSGVADEHTKAGVSYGTSYWYRQTGAPSFLATSVDFSTDIYVPSSVGTRYQAIEWDGEQHLGGYIYNYAWQAERPLGQWRWFEYGGGGWHDSGIPFTGFTPDRWHSVHAHYTVSGNTITNDWLEIDGVRHTPTKPTAHQRVAGGGTKMNIGLQLDQDSAGDAMSVYWDNVNLSYRDNAAPPCSAPVVNEPREGQSVGSAIHLYTSAPACIVTTRCYLASSGGAVVASGGRTVDGAWVSVPLGADSIACNGWDAAGKAYVGARVGFVRRQ
jgi:hypothetical protein